MQLKREEFFAQVIQLDSLGDRQHALDEFMQLMYSVEWLRGVGKSLTDPPNGGQLLLSWEDAWGLYLSPTFEAVRKDYTSRLEEAVLREQYRIEVWNDVNAHWTVKYHEETREKLRESVPMYCHTKARNQAICQQIQSGALEVAFADVAPNRFFRDWNYWWWRGYFPVEWNGGPIPDAVKSQLPPELRDQEMPIDFGVF